MSLRVWLPLTKDLRNQGLDEVEIINYGATFNSEGKLGGCYYFDGTDDRIVINGLTLPNIWSYSCWIYSATSSRGWLAVIMLNSTGGDADLQLGFYTYPAGNRIQNTANGQYNSGISWTYGMWHHFCGTFDGNNLKTYIDGILVNTKNITASLLTRSHLTVGARCNNSTNTSASNFFQGKLNDVRIYDHALSPLEVKEISKGLILHYPLNRNGWGQENNIAVSKIANRGCTNFTYDLSTQEWTMTCPAASSVWGYGIAINDRNIKWTINQTWVISMEVYVPHSITWNCDINNKPDLTDISEYTGNDYDVAGQRLVCSNGIKGSKTLQAGWNKIWFSQTANTTYGLTNYSTNWGIQTTNESSDIDIKIRKIKGEVIASGLPIQPTSWCPNSSDAFAITMGLNDNILYDTSGYGNNGTRIGTFSWTSDTPKYQVSTKFNTTSTKIKLPVISFTGMANSYTFAWWQYNISTGNMPWGFSDGNRLNCYHCSPLCWNTGDGSSNQFKDGSTTVTPATIQNGWHHMVITGDGTATKLYIDGVYKGTAITYKPLTGTQIWISGWDSGTLYTFSGSKECDFRIYATALSAENVKSLYNNSAYIDNQGNIYGAVYEEV